MALAVTESLGFWLWLLAATTAPAWVASGAVSADPDPDAADPDEGAADWDIVAGGWV
jgi:hypothetical protein